MIGPTVFIWWFNYNCLLSCFMNKSLAASDSCFVSSWCSFHLFCFDYWRNETSWFLRFLSFFRCFNFRFDFFFNWSRFLSWFFLSLLFSRCLLLDSLSHWLLFWRWLLSYFRSTFACWFLHYWLWLYRFNFLLLDRRAPLLYWWSSFLDWWFSLSYRWFQCSLCLKAFYNFLQSESWFF